MTLPQGSTCPTCGQAVRRTTGAAPAASWVAAARRNSLHEFSGPELERLDAFAVALRGLRARSGQTRRQLARSSGLSPSYIKHLEIGSRRPRTSTIVGLAAGLRPAPPVYRLGGTVRFPGDPVFRSAYERDESAVAQAAHRELFEAIGTAVAPGPS